MLATEQWVNITFCVLIHKSPSETLGMLEEAYGKTPMKEKQVYEWKYKSSSRIRRFLLDKSKEIFMV
jgi:hypothetical protein